VQISDLTHPNKKLTIVGYSINKAGLHSELNHTSPKALLNFLSC